MKGLFKGEGDLSAAEKRPGFTSNVSKGVSGIVSGIGSKFSKKEDDSTPPPLPTLSYHVAINGNSVGPLNYEELREFVMEGKLTPDSLVWKKGMESWGEAKMMEDLSPLFEVEETETPPPIPDI